MGRFDRYLLSQQMRIFGFFALVLVLVYWINRAVVLFDQLIADGHSATVFFEFTALSLPNVIRLVAPIAAFAAAVYVANRMAGESELVVAQSSGLSPWILLRPVALFGLLCAAGTLVLTLVLVPLSLRMLADRTADLSRDVTASLLVEGAFLHPADDVTFYIARITDRGELQGVFLSDARSDRQQITYTARSALLLKSESGPVLAMFDGQVQTLQQADDRLTVTRFDEFAFDIGSLMKMPTAGRRRIREVATAELLNPDPALVDETRSSVPALVFSAHERVSQGLLALVAPLLGFACMLQGRFSRFGAWRQIVLGVASLIALNLTGNIATDAILNGAAHWSLIYGPIAGGLVATLVLAWIAAHPGWLLRHGPWRRGAPA
ncbi:N-terminal of permease YjgP/YjgQ family protein [Oceaniovalibus guishaninsula JLT2003]|uniref:N-terminal of permease YjgP/YjgQ family protein n=2 Tax=Oceaniovalibus TaxID=1207070 RepID=K2IA16_9RHOB|nr:N-terminal of permease YjgP/YjgQ family protein [Oceaniovalibus guishaninsula JLT2003]